MTKPRPPLQPLPPVAAGQVHAPLNRDRTTPYKIAGLIVALVAAAGMTLTWLQFRGAFDSKAQVYVLASRAGLSMDNGSKVTYNGVPIGRLKGSEVVAAPGEKAQAKLILDVDPRYLSETLMLGNPGERR